MDKNTFIAHAFNQSYKHHLKLAKDAEILNDYRNALKHLTAALVYKPQSEKIYYMRGRIYFKINFYNNAIIDFSYYLNQRDFDCNASKKDMKVYCMKSISNLVIKKKINKNCSEYRSFFYSNFWDTFGYFLMGFELISKGSYEKGLEFFENLNKNYPDFFCLNKDLTIHFPEHFKPIFYSYIN